MKKNVQKQDLKEILFSNFQVFENNLNGSITSPIHKIRRDAISAFNRCGFPTTRMEEWKYTNVKPIIEQDYKPLFADQTSQLTKKDIKQFLIPGLKTHTIVLINGYYVKALSSNISKLAGSFIGSFADAQIQMNDMVQKHFAQYANYKNEAFTALNTAFAKEGAFIYLSEKACIENPILILNIIDSKKNALIAQPRNLIIAEKNSQATIIECQHTIGDNLSLNNMVTEVYIDKHALITYYKVQNKNNNSFYINTTEVHQEKNSVFSSLTFTWNGLLTRNNLNAIHNDERCETNFYGLYVLKDQQHVDNHTLMDHAKPNCNSNELYKGILDDESTGIFNGKIMVRKDAQKINAYQLNNNILLSNDATLDTKPQLEIFADDVKCSHGTTTGQLNKDELFYLRSRGISESTAKAMLLFAFANEIIDKISIEPFKRYINKILSERLDISI